MDASQEFTGRTVEEAIEAACTALACPRDELEIQVVSAGTATIFGICLKKARIRARRRTAGGGKTRPVPQPAGRPATAATPAPPAPATVPAGGDAEPPTPAVAAERLLTGLLAAIPARCTVTVRQPGDDPDHLTATLEGPDLDRLLGRGGEGLDAIQYLLRKMLSKEFRRRIAITVDGGDYRNRRRRQLETEARQLAAAVRDTGRGRTTGPLNPAERRIVHLAIQDEEGVRSRSVGTGLYKKVLVYLPGRSRRGSRSSGHRPEPADNRE